MNNLVAMQLKLYELCRYDDNEPNYQKYNDSIMDTINNMPLQSLIYALEDFKQ